MTTTRPPPRRREAAGQRPRPWATYAPPKRSRPPEVGFQTTITVTVMADTAAAGAGPVPGQHRRHERLRRVRQRERRYRRSLRSRGDPSSTRLSPRTAYRRLQDLRRHGGLECPVQPRRLADGPVRGQDRCRHRAARHGGAGRRHQPAVLAGDLRDLERLRDVHRQYRRPRLQGDNRPDQVAPRQHRQEPARDLHGAGRPAHHGAVGHLSDRIAGAGGHPVGCHAEGVGT
jgi:hypothetical protein